jgi:hypothetical protein
MTAVMGGGTYHDDSYRPVTVVAGPANTPGQ